MFRRHNRRRLNLRDRLRERWEGLVDLAQRGGPYVVLALVAVAVPYLVFLGYKRVISSPYFQVSDIDIQGARFADVQSLAERAGLEYGVPIFEVGTSGAAEVFESDPWVREAAVERVLPDAVSVELEERRPAAVLVEEGIFAVDQQGRVIEAISGDEESDQFDLPFVTGFGPADLERKESRELMREAIEVASIYEELELDAAEELSEIHVDPVLGLTIMTEESATEIRLGRGDYRERLQRLEPVRRSLARKDIEPGYILLDREESLDRITVGRRQDQGTVEGDAN